MINHNFSNYPIFTPLVGLESNKIYEFLGEVSKNLIKLNYCNFKPKDQ